MKSHKIIFKNSEFIYDKVYTENKFSNETKKKFWKEKNEKFCIKRIIQICFKIVGTIFCVQNKTETNKIIYLYKVLVSENKNNKTVIKSSVWHSVLKIDSPLHRCLRIINIYLPGYNDYLHKL